MLRHFVMSCNIIPHLWSSLVKNKLLKKNMRTHCLDLDLNAQNLFIKCLWLRPSAYFLDKSGLIGLYRNWLARFQKFFLFLNCMIYLECIRSYAWYFGHPDLNLSSAQRWEMTIFCPVGVCEAPVKNSRRS